MDTCFKKGIAFILEGDTEKIFYTALLRYLCTKHVGVSFEKHSDPSSGEIFYTIGTEHQKVLVMFNVVGTISQIANSGNWFEKRCYNRFKDIEWCVFLCYDTDNYIPNISKFYEGDWKELRKAISKHKSCSIIDLAAEADIEDIILIDEASIFSFLRIAPIPIPSGSKGKIRLRKLFRSKGRGCAYHAGDRAEPLINALDFEKIISHSPVQLHQIELKCFDCFNK